MELDLCEGKREIQAFGNRAIQVLPDGIIFELVQGPSKWSFFTALGDLSSVVFTLRYGRREAKLRVGLLGADVVTANSKWLFRGHTAVDVHSDVMTGPYVEGIWAISGRTYGEIVIPAELGVQLGLLFPE